MSSQDPGQGTMTGEHTAPEIQSPTEKIEGRPPEGDTLPGVENPESSEVKQEINPNTE